jgi:hypothetical protein
VHPEPPLRALPEHSVPGPGAPRPSTERAPYGLDGTSDTKPPTEEQPPAEEGPAAADKPVFKEPDFSGGTSTPNAEVVLSPTETR